MGIDYGAQGASATGFNNPWWGTPAMTACTNARTYLLTTLGASGSTKIGFLDYSLGGGTGFNWNSRNNTLVSGIISYAPACDGDYFYNLAGQPINQGYAASMDLAYAASTTTLTGSGTLNQVGSTLTLTGAMGLPVSGTLIIYQRTTYQNIAVGATGAIYVAYTAGGGTTTLLNCTIATGSQTWGTAGDGTWTGAATPGAWAANAATRSPVLIATNPAFDNVPLHLYTGTADATVPTSQVQTFATAVGPNAVVHSIAGGTHTSIVNNPAQISSAEILSIVSSFGW
jgi:pimeloyl-ACP methyl ester carboxylesterase